VPGENEFALLGGLTAQTFAEPDFGALTGLRGVLVPLYEQSKGFGLYLIHKKNGALSSKRHPGDFNQDVQGSGELGRQQGIGETEPEQTLNDFLLFAELNRIFSGNINSLIGKRLSVFS